MYLSSRDDEEFMLIVKQRHPAIFKAAIERMQKEAHTFDAIRYSIDEIDRMNGLPPCSDKNWPFRNGFRVE